MNKTTRGFVSLVALAVLAGASFALLRFGVYGWTIFLLVPSLLGALTAWVFRPASGTKAASWGALSTVAALALFLLAGLEGLICIAMALPLAAPLGALGGWLAFRAASGKLNSRGVALLLLLPPASIGVDTQVQPPIFEVRSSVEIVATPEQVWQHVVVVSEIPGPQEWYFRSGVAYPTRARIHGSGVGATRYCDLSTGPIVEPVEIWDAPRVLQFRVTETPAPLVEWSPYEHVTPKHLHGYFMSKRGRFQLTRLANNHTLLEGTSWYQHGLWPAQYWRWWSDAIVHRIHMRVLNHIRTLSENDAGEW